MKILYICTYYHRAMVFRDAMNYLEQRGNSLSAFNAVAKGSKIDDKYKAIMDDKVIHKECFTRFDRYFFRRKQKKIFREIVSDVNIKSFDLIHSHTLFNGGWAAYQIHRKYGIPYVVSVRNTDLNVFLKIPMFKRIAKRIVDNAAGVLFLSAAYKEKFLNLCYSCGEQESVLKKSDVIPNGLEPFWLENKAEARQTVHQPLRLLCVGKIDRNKNMSTTLQAVDKLNEEGMPAQLTVIGQVLDESVQSLLTHNKNVTLIPYMKKEELIDYYRESDVFVMPSFHETFGRVYAEAMTQGVPVIYTRGQGFDGTFEEGEVGYSVRAEDSYEIAKAIKAIVKNYGTISSNCVRNCPVFDWKDISERLENLYSKAIAR